MRIAIRYLCFLVVMMSAGTLYSQTITGKVTDNENLPLPGATVIVKGTQTSTVTDIDGSYKLSNVKTGSTLEFSFIGFLMKSVVANSAEINASLTPNTQELNEIIVVGASVKRSDLTGAVANVEGKKLTETPTSNVVQAMQGRAAGVYVQQSSTPGGNASIKIRGNNSIQFGTNPIFVVDGLIIEGGFDSINPNDIANIDILKDASSTAIYGARGANGVVVITTKKGTKGEGKVNFDTWVGLSEFSKAMPLMNGQQLFDLRVDAFANQYMDKNPGADRAAYINQIKSDGSTVFAPYELASYRNGKSYDWLNEVTRTGVQTNYNLSFSGGGDKGSYFMSFNYADEDGLLKDSSFKRYNGKINLTQDVKSWLQVGTNTTFSRSIATYIEGSAFGNALGANPLLPIDPNATYLKYGDVLNSDAYNPIKSLTIDNTSSKNRLMSSNFVNIKPTSGLSLRTTFSVDITDQANFSYQPIDTGQSIRNSANGDANHYRYSELNYQWDNTITYAKTIGKHDFSALGAFSVQKNTNNYTQVDARGFASDDFTYMYLNGASQKQDFTLGSDFVTTSLMSYTGRLNYSYDKKYFATVTTRLDGSSRFGPNNKWGTFPSVALGWDISKDFLQSVESIKLLKLRGSYGIAGNQNIPNYSYVSKFRPVYTNGTVVYQPSGYLGNPDLQWERQKQFDFGLDFATANNRLSMTVDYFNIKNDNLLMVIGVTKLSGFGSQVDNVGEMVNKGLEFSANYKILRENDFNWDISANISSAKNKVTALYGDTSAIYNKGGYTGVEIQRTGNLFVGQSINSIYVFQFDKIAQTSDMADISKIDFGGRTVKPGDIVPVDRNKDGKIDDNDRYVVGNTDPDAYGGFATDFSYKGFGLNAVFAYSIGGKRISSAYESFMSSGGMSAAHTDLLDRWTPEHTDTNVPRAYYGGGRFNSYETSLAIQNASFLRLNALTLSYNLPSQLLEKAYLKNMRLYVTGSNLFTATKYKGYDPEGGDGYPSSRMFVLGLNVSL
ncbi:SusC/RagA family TonB-linked outer membrane protein [Flavobacterium pectinovorum]|jgi:TonB-linked SusC/RagA family outer membrane protein|uniref:TonB-dependent receptor n=1 Tax=Flavobacterium pectinovorum TaxID=29533 RepID=A0A502ESJ0_9FLAO|nr:TonB-dependent receptor [Flavobacterium pectinovorum]TPG40793.1 TonB-dependent receptor [Flavobacterium pectinovorum]